MSKASKNRTESLKRFKALAKPRDRTMYRLLKDTDVGHPKVYDREHYVRYRYAAYAH